MNAIVATMPAYARKVTTYLLDATVTWDTDASHKIVVPAGKRWFLIVANMKQDVSQTCAIRWLDSSDVIIAQLQAGAANTTHNTWPNMVSSSGKMTAGKVIMDPGEKIHFSSAGSQGSGAYIYLHALEVDI